MSFTISKNMEEKQEVHDFVKNLQQGLKKFSLKELNDELQAIIEKRYDKQKDKEKQISLVIDLVCKEYNIPRNTLIHSRTTSELKQPRTIAYCLLHFTLHLPIRYIAKNVFFLKFHNSVGVAIKYYNTINTKIAPDKEFIDTYTKIQTNAIKKLKTEKI
jgi:chromosomal replication initiation ATPase DnaA